MPEDPRPASCLLREASNLRHSAPREGQASGSLVLREGSNLRHTASHHEMHDKRHDRQQRHEPEHEGQAFLVDLIAACRQPGQKAFGASRGLLAPLGAFGAVRQQVDGGDIGWRKGLAAAGADDSVGTFLLALVCFAAGDAPIFTLRIAHALRAGHVPSARDADFRSRRCG
jgi:hypothetical protein